MFLLFFLLWLLLSGGVSTHICLWGLAVSAVITWFCRRVLGYDWHILLGDSRKLSLHRIRFLRISGRHISTLRQ